MTTGALDITILNAEKLKSLTFLGKQRPYIVCQVGHQKERSKVCEGKNPRWNETFRFFISEERTAFITIKKKNKLTSDQVIGNVEVDLDKVLGEGRDSQNVPVVTAIGDRCCSQIMTEKGTLRLSLSFESWSKTIRSSNKSSK